MSVMAWVFIGLVVYVVVMIGVLCVCSMAGSCDPDRELEDMRRDRVGR